jgi:signal transduction histidine kinase
MEKEYGLLNDEKLEQHCQDINTNAQYLSQTIDDFKDFIKGDKQKVDFSLSKEIEALLHLVESNTKNLHIQVFTNLDDEIRLFGYPNELKQSMINIFNNAKDALENIDENERLLFINTYKKDKYIYISIKDNANGIPEAIIGKIFEPYFTTKHQSQGTGLGLHMSYNLIKEGLHGKIIASNVTYEYNEKSYKGAEFKIKIPILY